MTKLTVAEAIRQALEDDGFISKYEARVLRELILSDNFVSDDERAHLQGAIDANSLDESAFAVLASLLKRDTNSST